MIISNLDSGGCLPPITTVFTKNLHHQPPSSSTTQESELTAAINRGICKIRDVVAAATDKNPIRGTKSDTCGYKRHRTRTARRNSLRWTALGKRKICPSRNSGSQTLDREDVPRLRYRDFSHESEVQEKENAGEDNPSEAITEADKGGEECVGLKQVDQGEGERIGFKRLDDGALRIQMCCSCQKRFEILHNHIGCFYRLI